MTMTTGMIIAASALLILAGLVGTVVPALPGTALIFGGALLYAWGTHFAMVGAATLWLLGGITLATIVLDYVASAYGARRAGSTAAGVWGSVIGALLGLAVFNLPGLVLGTFLGAALAEVVFAGASGRAAVRSGVGAVLGFLGGTVMKLIAAVVMIGIFLAAVL